MEFIEQHVDQQKLTFRCLQVSVGERCRLLIIDHHNAATTVLLTEREAGRLHNCNSESM